MSRIKQIKHLLTLCSTAQREEVFQHLRREFSIHPLEAKLHTKAEIILEAIHRAGGLTLRMMRGVIAEAAFEVEVVERLKGWRKIPRTGDLPYDFLLTDREGDVRVQVKLQRSKADLPLAGQQGQQSLSVLAGRRVRRRNAENSRGEEQKDWWRHAPVPIGEFDLLAVAMYSSTNRWDTFMYTVANWLLPGLVDPLEISKYQPVASTSNDDWTDNFRTAVGWLRSGRKKTIHFK